MYTITIVYKYSLQYPVPYLSVTTSYVVTT